jgi:hypothetical protein
MTVAITALKSGDVVYDARKVRQGNTTIRRLSVWAVRIIDVDAEGGKVIASWNGNPAKAYHASSGKFPWSRTKPVTRTP